MFEDEVEDLSDVQTQFRNLFPDTFESQHPIKKPLSSLNILLSQGSSHVILRHIFD